MFKKIFMVLLVAAVAFVLIVAMQPAEFKITRSQRIKAPAEAIFAQVNDFRKWGAWSPWEKIDPAMKRSFEGTASGVGAIYAWSGNNEVGQGRMTIEKSRPNERIEMKLEFLKPFAATHAGEFSFKPEGNETVVTWTMSGERNFVAKAFSLVMNMDKMVGGQFEQGLHNLKGIVEGAR